MNPLLKSNQTLAEKWHRKNQDIHKQKISSIKSELAEKYFSDTNQTQIQMKSHILKNNPKKTRMLEGKFISNPFINVYVFCP